MSFFDNFGSFADSVGGWVEDITPTATGILGNVAKIQASINAVQNPGKASKGPAVPLVPNIASASSAVEKKSNTGLYVILGVGLVAALLLTRKG